MNVMRDTLEGHLDREVIAKINRGFVDSPSTFFHVTGKLKSDTQDEFSVHGDLSYVNFMTTDVEQVITDRSGTTFIVFRTWSGL